MSDPDLQAAEIFMVPSEDLGACLGRSSSPEQTSRFGLFSFAVSVSQSPLKFSSLLLHSCCVADVSRRHPPTDVTLQTEFGMICVLFLPFHVEAAAASGEMAAERSCVREFHSPRRGRARRAPFYFGCFLNTSVCWLFHAFVSSVSGSR